MVWVSFLNRSNFSSLSTIARMIGAGKPARRSSRFSVMVLRNAKRKSLFWKALMKYSKP